MSGSDRLGVLGCALFRRCAPPDPSGSRGGRPGRAAPTRAVWLVALLSALTVAQEPLLEENFRTNERGWQVDDFSRLVDGAYVVDARGAGGYARWIEQPATLRDGVYRVELRNQRPAPGARFGLLLRLQATWEHSYFALLDGAGRYAFGKFVAGKSVVLKEGVHPAIATDAAPNVLEVEAQGATFGLRANGQPLATVVDATFAVGKVGLFVEAPAKVRFGALQVTPTTSSRPGGEPRVLFRDSFDAPNGWPEDAYRVLAGGAYHLVNHGESPSFSSWNAATANLTDFVARLDARQVTGSDQALHGVLWRLRDATHYYFALLSPDGRYYAGVRNGDGPADIRRQGRHLAIRGSDRANSLEVRAAGPQFRVRVNGSELCGFVDGAFTSGALGVYVQQPADVAFDDLVVTDLPENAPPVVGATPSTPLAARTPAREPVFADRLDRAGEGGWTAGADRAFEQGGLCLRAPDEGSRTALRARPVELADGVFQVTARPVAGPVQSGYGLVFRAEAKGRDFYFLLLNGAGRYFLGKCLDGKFSVLDAGPVSLLRGGDAGNVLTVEARGPILRYSINDQPLGLVQDDSLQRGGVGLHVEHALVACFRDLRAYAPEPGPG